MFLGLWNEENNPIFVHFLDSNLCDLWSTQLKFGVQYILFHLCIFPLNAVFFQYEWIQRVLDQLSPLPDKHNLNDYSFVTEIIEIVENIHF